MSDKRYTKDGEYLSKPATLALNARHGWLQYGDAQSDASNAFANNAVHAFLESAKQTQEVLTETGLTPRQLVEQRDLLAVVIEELLTDVKHDNDGSGYADAVIHSQDVARARAALALVKGSAP